MSEMESTRGISTAPANSKESPLTDIATSPPSFDFLSQDKYSNGDGRTDRRANGDAGSHETTQQTRDSYESSELSDVGDDQSEAETDKMDFLEDDGHEDSKSGSDLQTLANLTKMARMKDVDSDYDESDKSSSDAASAVKLEDGKLGSGADDSQEMPNHEDSIQDGSVEGGLKSDSEFEDRAKPKRKIKEDGNARVKKPRIREPQPEEHEEHEEHDDESGNDTSLPNNGDTSERGERTVEDQSDTGELEADEDDDEEGEGVLDDEEAEAEAGDGTAVDEAEDEAKEDLSEEDFDLNEQRKLAIDDLISIESSFAELRDKLYQDKLTLLEHELQLCLDGSHPELSKIYYKVSGFYEESVELANSTLNYKLKCINNETLATRTSIHQNFLKNLMDCKHQLITNATTLWYKINKERNEMDQFVPNFSYAAVPSVPKYAALPQAENGYADGSRPNEIQDKIPLSKKDIKQNTLYELVKQRNSLNHQLGALNNLSQFYGFPSSIDTSVDNDVSPAHELLLTRATEEEMMDDYKAMGITI